MRQVKVRAWHPELKYFIYCDPLHLIYDVHAGGYRIVGDQSINIVYHCFKGEPLGQMCIGVRDMNGKEIYEGDIIANQAGRTFIIDYVYRGFEYREILMVDGKRVLQKNYTSSIGSEQLCRVVGNIIENPIV